MRHILSVDQFSKDLLFELVGRAIYHQTVDGLLRHEYAPVPHHSYHPHGWIMNEAKTAWVPRWVCGRLMTNLFYEPSSRTSSSFHAAMVRLGGQVIAINNVNYSSVAKGETLEDTVRTMQCYSDVIVLRHTEVGAAARAAAAASVPIINAGDGIGEHPTQALLDFYTILAERKSLNNKLPLPYTIHSTLDGLNIGMMGDLKHGRTVKSLSKLLNRFGVRITWISPEELRIPEEYKSDHDIEVSDLSEVIADLDVLYVTRVQKERIDGNCDFSYHVTPEHMALARPNMVLMHPLPRVSEIPTKLDSDPRSAYFRQMKYGLFIRMAVLATVLENA